MFNSVHYHRNEGENRQNNSTLQKGDAKEAELTKRGHGMGDVFSISSPLPLEIEFSFLKLLPKGTDNLHDIFPPCYFTLQHGKNYSKIK